MQGPDRYVRLAEILDRLLEREPVAPEFAWFPRFSLEPATQHASKSEFEIELATVSALLKKMEDLLALFLDSNVSTKAALEDLRWRIDDVARSKTELQKPVTPWDVPLATSIAASITVATLVSMTTWRANVLARKEELLDQKKLFWSPMGNPPDLYARTIALRFAKYCAGQTGERCTANPGRPKSQMRAPYRRALEEIFEMLGIVTGIKAPAQWALEQITDYDLLTGDEKLVGLLSGDRNQQFQQAENDLGSLVGALLRGMQ